MTAKIICFIGIDGSGKSTLARNLQSWLLAHNARVRYAHAYHNPLLLLPAKWLARGVFLRRLNQRGDYSAYRTQKSFVASRHALASRLYGGMWLLDYSLQALFTVSLPRQGTDILILDRYIYDTAINVSLSLERPASCAWAMIESWLRLYPKPTQTYLVDVAAEVAFSRKTDIPSIEYLRERRNRYLAAAEIFHFQVLDGQRSPEELQEIVRHDPKLEPILI